MKKLHAMAILPIIVMCLTAGCQLLQSGDSKQSVYEAGRLTASLHIATEGIQPADVNKTIKAAYQVGQLVLGSSTIPSDGELMLLISELHPDADENFERSVFLIYVNARARLRAQIGSNPELDTATVLKEFMRGIDDVLAEWEEWQSSEPE